MTKEYLKDFKLVLGLEIHLQLNTEYKMFCGCNADTWGDEPNTHTCPVCLGLPGALPVPNREAIKKTHMLGLSFGCKINLNSRFDRKHYFYPDLPKGFQISQYKQPFCEYGKMELDSGSTIDITRIHLEEDTAKSFHEGKKTLIDFNKSGIPLVEIVTEPCFRSVEDAVEFSHQARNVARILGVSDADMEKGQMRVEPNISIRTKEMEEKNELPDFKVEIKNINSFKFMEKAVIAEIKRQVKVLEEGGKLVQENRGYDENRNITKAQRQKEEAHDYRYFPEPDIPPFEFDKKEIDILEEELPELPWDVKERLEKAGMDKNKVKIVVDNLGIEYVNKLDELVKGSVKPGKAINLVLNTPDILEKSIKEIIKGIKESQNKMTDSSELSEIIDDVIKENPHAVKDFKNGKTSSMEFLLGMVMRKTKGRADPKITRDLINSHLAE